MRCGHPGSARSRQSGLTGSPQRSRSGSVLGSCVRVCATQRSRSGSVLGFSHHLRVGLHADAELGVRRRHHLKLHAPTLTPAADIPAADGVP